MALPLFKTVTPPKRLLPDWAYDANCLRGCPEHISIASTHTIPGIGALRPRLIRTEHPVTDMVNESLRLLTDRIARPSQGAPRHVVFQPALILGDSCRPVRKSAGIKRG